MSAGALIVAENTIKGRKSMGKCALLVCLFFLERGSDAPSTLAVRRRQRRRFLSPLLHGFTLRASPAVKHGAPPPEARVDLCGCSMLAVRHRQRRSSLCLLSTGSPFGRHPRLSMVRLRRRREWICAVAQCLQCDATRGESISVWMLLKRRDSESVYRLYTICKNRGRRSSG